MRLVASSIRAMRWQAGPRSSSQRNGELSCITNSPNLARRSRHTCTACTRWRRGRHKAALVIHFRSVSRLTAQTFLSQVFGGQRGAEIRVTLAHPRQNLLLEPSPPACGSRVGRAVHERAHHRHAGAAQQHPPHVAVAYFQPQGRGYLRQMSSDLLRAALSIGPAPVGST